MVSKQQGTKTFSAGGRFILALALIIPSAECFATQSASKKAFLSKQSKLSSAATDTPVDSPSTGTTDIDEELVAPRPESATAVRAPLKYIGPYPCIGLRFPFLATPSQRRKNARGISLDFVMDTAANVNTIHAQVADELGLDVVQRAPPVVVGPGGAQIQGGDTYMLGDCELENQELVSAFKSTDDEVQQDERFTFMTGLTASALPIANSVSAGIMSLTFLKCFSGVEFMWGTVNAKGELSTPGHVTFYDGEDEQLKKMIGSMKRVPISNLPVTDLPSVTISINGVTMPALLDTGSPITVMNAKAAELANVKTVVPSSELPSNRNSNGRNNPLANLGDNVKLAQAASRGEVVALADAKGQPVYLLKSADAVDMKIDGSGSIVVDCGKGNLFVGDLPGLAALNGLGVDAPPAVVLGMDVLRTQPRMLYRGQTNEIYF